MPPNDKPVALVTGASAGIGLYTSIGLARAGMRVIMIGRNADRLERAHRTVIDRYSSADVETALADFASLVQVRALGEMLAMKHPRLDVLINNAGQITPRFALSQDHIEMMMAVNHLAPFLLTNLLLDRLKASAPSRIITVASQAHQNARLKTDELARPSHWNPLSGYGRSKLCNVLFTKALARRLAGTGVTAMCLHPGVVSTDIGDSAGLMAGLGWRLIKPFLISPEQGAETSIFLATVADPTPFNGAYVIRKKVAQPDPIVFNEALGERLWTESAKLVRLPA